MRAALMHADAQLDDIGESSWVNQPTDAGLLYGGCITSDGGYAVFVEVEDLGEVATTPTAFATPEMVHAILVDVNQRLSN